MNGPQHYAEAQRLIEFVHSTELPMPALTIAAAQVHATLALAAATVDANALRTTGARFEAWAEATT